MMSRWSLVPLFVSVSVSVSAGIGIGVVAGETARPTGAALCVLTPNDFTQAGVVNATKPSANVQDGLSIPAHKDAQAQLTTLSGLVLKRL